MPINSAACSCARPSASASRKASKPSKVKVTPRRRPKGLMWTGKPVVSSASVGALAARFGIGSERARRLHAAYWEQNGDEEGDL